MTPDPVRPGKEEREDETLVCTCPNPGVMPALHGPECPVFKVYGTGWAALAADTEPEEQP